MHLDFSPIKGPEGNIEYLIHIRKDPEKNEAVSILTEAEGEKALREITESGAGISQDMDYKRLIDEVVDNAHGSLS